jgi:ABC-type nitrate/sulfonate/bicarbonate transport system substrate-binding protein
MEKKRNPIWWFVVLFAVLASVLVSAYLFGGGTPEDTGLPVVRYINFRVYDPVYVGIDKGFYEGAGITVEIVGDAIAGPNAIQAVAGGSAEAGLSSIPALTLANAQGLPIQGVVDVQTTMDSQALQKWYVSADSPLRSLEDVLTADEPPVYCVNIWRSSFHTTSLMAFDQREIPEEAVVWKLLSFANQINALTQGECDIIGLIPPYQAYLEQEFGSTVRVLFNDYDDVYGAKHVSLIFVNRIWARENPDTAERFVKGTADAINWIEENQNEARAIVSKYTEIPIEAVLDYHFTDNGCVIPADIEFWHDYLLKRGDMTADWVLVEDVGTDRYNPYCE